MMEMIARLGIVVGWAGKIIFTLSVCVSTYAFSTGGSAEDIFSIAAIGVFSLAAGLAVQYVLAGR